MLLSEKEKGVVFCLFVFSLFLCVCVCGNNVPTSTLNIMGIDFAPLGSFFLLK